LIEKNGLDNTDVFVVSEGSFIFSQAMSLSKKKIEPLELSTDFKYILDNLERSHDNFFITGRAGTGKSTLLQLFRNTTRKKTVVLAPTGIAALNVKGQTIHSFFGFPPKLIQKNDIKPRKQRSLFKNLEIIVIDEVSMVRADIMDGIDYSLQINRRDNRPFGGVQMVFFGDLFQLPPVVSSAPEKEYFNTYYSSPYFFSSKIIEQGFPVKMIELLKVYRQDEKAFIKLLDAIRIRSFEYDDLEDLNYRYNPNFESNEPFITVCTINAIADAINAEKLSNLPGDIFTYRARVTGSFHPKLFPTEASLKLKEGAQIILLKNDPMKRFVNGSIALITELSDDEITLRIEKRNGETEIVQLEQAEWEIMKYEYSAESPNKIDAKVVGSFTQFPIRLAWAITIHKSQGKTFDRVMIDLGRGAFEYGQAYVALSRCRTLDGIVLKQKIKPSDILVDPRILEFYDMGRRYLT
jgi:hypothetical protein